MRADVPKRSYNRFHPTSSFVVKLASLTYSASRMIRFGQHLTFVAFTALFSGHSHRLTSTMMKMSQSFPSVKTSWKSAVFRHGAKSEPSLFPTSSTRYTFPFPIRLRSGQALAVRIPLFGGAYRAYPVDYHWRYKPGRVASFSRRGQWCRYQLASLTVRPSCLLTTALDLLGRQPLALFATYEMYNASLWFTPPVLPWTAPTLWLAEPALSAAEWVKPLSPELRTPSLP